MLLKKLLMAFDASRAVKEVMDTVMYNSESLKMVLGWRSMLFSKLY